MNWERDRSAISYVMDEKELRKYHKQQLKEKKRRYETTTSKK